MKLLSYWPWFLLFGIVLVLSLAAIPPYRQQADIEQVFNKGGLLYVVGTAPSDDLLGRFRMLFEKHGPSLNFDDVTWARLNTPEFGDEEVLRISRFSKLRGIELQDSTVTDSGLANLRGLKEIEELNLRSTAITDAGLEFLRDLKSLEGIYLHNSTVTNEGVNKLKQALPDCEIYH